MRRWSRINLTIQILMLSIALLALPLFTIYVLLILVPFGGWQVISSLVFALRFRQIEHRNRILFRVYWIVLGFLSIFYLLEYTNVFRIHDPFFIYMLISAGLGVYYLVISVRMTRNRTLKRTTFLPNILDHF